MVPQYDVSSFWSSNFFFSFTTGISFFGSFPNYAFLLQFGYIVLTTSAGIMDHEEARRKNVGGKVLGFFY